MNLFSRCFDNCYTCIYNSVCKAVIYWLKPQVVETSREQVHVGSVCKQPQHESSQQYSLLWVWACPPQMCNQGDVVEAHATFNWTDTFLSIRVAKQISVRPFDLEGLCQSQTTVVCDWQRPSRSKRVTEICLCYVNAQESICSVHSRFAHSFATHLSIGLLQMMHNQQHVTMNMFHISKLRSVPTSIITQLLHRHLEEE